MIHYIQSFGSIVYIGLSGDDKREIYREYLGYCNLKFSRDFIYTQADFVPYFGYFVDLASKLHQTMEFRELMRLLQKLDTLDHRNPGDSEETEELRQTARLNSSFNLSRFVPMVFISPKTCRIDEFQAEHPLSFLA